MDTIISNNDTIGEEMIKIAIDAMGGDYAPCEIVKGAVLGAKETSVGIILVGQEDITKSELNQYDISKLHIEIMHTDEFLFEGESPSLALRNKSNSSIIQCVKLVKEGKADAVISAGPTGGIVSSAVHILGTFEGISRPVIGGPLLGFAPDTILFDMGSNIDSQPKQLLDFAMLGTVYVEKIMGVANPTVALAGIGSEEGKGNRVSMEAYELLKHSGLNFIGNIEGNDIVSGKANVIVCDGFTGNILLKFIEGLSIACSDWLAKRLSEKISSDELLEVKAELNNLIRSVSPYCALLYGINGIICKAHGKSRSREICGLIKTVKNAVETDMVDKLKSGFFALKAESNL
jgi:glycerol-3-phosphate acyltransferase PlsX